MEHQSARPERWLGQTAVDASGHAFATVADVLLDARSAAAEWVIVCPKGPRGRHRPVPASMIVEEGDCVRLPVSRFTVPGAPQVRPREPVTADRELTLVRYWRGLQ